MKLQLRPQRSTHRQLPTKTHRETCLGILSQSPRLHNTQATMKPEPVLDPHPLDYRVTILVCVAAAGLTFKSFQGFDMSMLMILYPAWPQEHR